MSFKIYGFRGQDEIIDRISSWFDKDSTLIVFRQEKTLINKNNIESIKWEKIGGEEE